MTEPPRYETFVGDAPAAPAASQLAGGGLWDFLGDGLDALAAGQKGRIVTAGVIAAGLSRNPAAQWSHFNAHKDAIDGYINLMNTGKLVRMAAQPATCPSPLPWLAVGVLLGAGAMYLMNDR